MLMGPAANMQFLYKSEKNVAPAVAAAPPSFFMAELAISGESKDWGPVIILMTILLGRKTNTVMWPSASR